MPTNILSRILKPDHTRVGLFLAEDDHTVYLCVSGKTKPIARYSAPGITGEEILKDADQYLNTLDAGIEFARN